MKFIIFSALLLIGTTAFASDDYTEITEYQFCLKSNHPHRNGVLLGNANYTNFTNTPYSIVCMHPKLRNFMTLGNNDGVTPLIQHDQSCLEIIYEIRNNPGAVFNFKVDTTHWYSQRLIEVEKSKTERCDKNFEIFNKKHL